MITVSTPLTRIYDRLFHAASAGNTERLKRVLGECPDVNALDRYGMSALHNASQSGHIDCVIALLSCRDIEHSPVTSREVWLYPESGTDEGIAFPKGTTPREMAEKQGHTDIVTVIDEAIKTREIQLGATNRHRSSL